jgi:hypothetical protein
VTESLFGDLPSMERFERDCKNVCHSIKEYEDGLFNNWHDTILKTIKNPNLKEKYEMTG